MGDENESKAEDAADRAEAAAETAQEAAAVAVVAEVVADAQSGDRGAVYDNQQREDAQVAALNGAVSFLEGRVARLEDIARRQGYMGYTL